jgi:rod shape-determining protein MreC
MAASSGETPALFAPDGHGTLQVAGWLLLAIVLMVVDYRTGAVGQVRSAFASLADPLYRIAATPTRAARVARDAVGDRRDLMAENEQLRQSLLLSEARLGRYAALAEQNARLRELLGVRERYALEGRLAELIDIDLDPFRHRLLLGVGRDGGIEPGQAVIDGRGVMGQVIAAEAQHATMLLVTDPGHAIPVTVLRSGLRAIAYGTGSTDALRLPHIPFSADVRVGDALVTSGLGGRFPSGLPVGTIRELKPDDTGTFVEAIALPAAGLARSGEVLVLREEREAIRATLPETAASLPGTAEPAESAAAPDATPDDTPDNAAESGDAATPSASTPSAPSNPPASTPR